MVLFVVYPRRQEITTNNNTSAKIGDALFSEAPVWIEPHQAPGSGSNPIKSADGSRVNGLRSEANRSAVATSTLDKLGLLMEVVRRSLQLNVAAHPSRTK